MRKVTYTSIIMFLAVLTVVACGRKMKALERASFINSLDTVNGNLQLANDVDSAALALAGKYYTSLFDSQDEVNRHNQLKNEIAGLELTITAGNNNTRAVRVRVSEKNCGQTATIQSFVDEARLSSRNFAVDIGSNNNYNVRMVCIPTTQNGKTRCTHYLMAITKRYSTTSTGSIVTIMGYHEVTGQYMNWTPTKPIKYYHKLAGYNEICAANSVANSAPAPTGNAGNTANPVINDPNQIFIDPNNDFSSVVPADPSGDVSLNPFVVDTGAGTTTDTSSGDVSLNPFVIGNDGLGDVTTPAPATGGTAVLEFDWDGDGTIDTNSAGGSSANGAPFETVPVSGDEPIFFEDGIF